MVFPIITIVTYIFMVWEVCAIWLAPSSSDVAMIQSVTALVGFEFVLVHAAAVLSSLSTKRALLVFLPLYGLFAFAFNAVMPNTGIMYLYALLVFNRMSFSLSQLNTEQRAKDRAASQFAVVLYFLLGMFTVVGYSLIPRLGLTDDFLFQSDYFQALTVRGIWPDNPQLPIAFCAVYFSILCAREVMGIKDVFAKDDNQKW